MSVALIAQIIPELRDAIGPVILTWYRGGWGGYHHFGHGFGIGYIGGGYDDSGCYVVRRVATPYGYRLRTVNVCEY